MRILDGRVLTAWRFINYYISGLADRASRHHILLLGGGMAFSLILCILPLVLIVFSVIGVVLERSSVSSEISNFIHQLVPYPEYANWLADHVLARVSEFKTYKGAAGVLGLVGLILAASSLFASMRIVLNRVFDVKTSQPIYVSKLRDLALVVGVVVYFLLSTTILPSVSVIENMASKVEFLNRFDLATFADLGVEVLSFVIIFFAFFALYYLVPQKRMSKRSALVSAVCASVLWKLAERAFGYYITSLATLKKIYGAYSLAVVIALWIYYTSLIFIIAAEIGQLYLERHRMRASDIADVAE